MNIYKYKKFYKSIGAVRCPYFDNELIAFNKKGLRHLLYKEGKKRLFSDQIRRLKLLIYCKRILEGEYKTVDHTITSKKGELGDFWAFDAFIDGLNMRLLVRKIGAGEKHFFDIFPLKH